MSGIPLLHRADPRSRLTDQQRRQTVGQQRRHPIPRPRPRRPQCRRAARDLPFKLGKAQALLTDNERQSLWTLSRVISQPSGAGEHPAIMRLRCQRGYWSLVQRVAGNEGSLIGMVVSGRGEERGPDSAMGDPLP